MGTTVVCAVLFGTFFFGVLSASLSKALRYEAPDECKWVVENNDGQDEDVALVCRVRTINSELDKTNFSTIQPQHTVRLRLECSDTLFFQSSLLSGSFQQLVELRELSIEYCKIGNLSDGAFKGLKELKNLTVKTHNTDWSAMTLEISPNAFSDEMRLLERLDLGENNMWSLPEGVLCPLYSLEVLNLTHNRLREVSSFKFTQHAMERCGGNLRILDLSRNNIDRLPPGQFSGLARLQKLYLQGNGLTHLADRAFEGLRTLNILKLSDNRLVSLPLELFSDNLEITEMYLRNNSINVLAPGLFRNVSQLLVLDLSHNELTEDWINAMTFANLVRLVVLDASFNRISKLEQTMFSDLFSLQILKLNDNFLESIPEYTFSELANLHTLIVSNNKLSRIDSNTLTGLYALSLLSLDNNRIFSIHPEALINCSALQDLHLNGNKLVEVPDVLLNVPMLKTLDLGENHIDTLTNNTFRDMKELYGLRLTENYIGNITKGVFGRMINLKILNLSRNKIQKVEPGSFDLNENLQAIRLDGNYLTDIDDLFGKLPHLVWLNISENQLKRLNYEQVPVNLQWLDVHANQIEQLSNYFEIKSSLSLSTFDISANKLTEISGSDIPNSIEVLYLNDNLINRVVPYTFYNKPNLTRVDLFGNKITLLDPLSLRISDIPADKVLPEFHIGGNPYKCDCTMDWLQKFNTENRSRSKPKLVDLESIYCQLLYNRGKTYVPLVEATPYQFLCSYDTHCFPVCHCCDFDACDCEMTCPKNCTCYRDESWSANVVDCSSRGYIEKLPQQVPMDATQLYLDGNDLRTMGSHALIGRKKLKILFLNNSNIESIENRTFNGLRNLEELHLDENHLTELKGYEFEGLESLREIHLQHNRIAVINNSTFIALSWLRVLYLDHNRLTIYDVWKLPLTLTKVSLAFNPWSCECEFTEKLREWMVKGDTVFDIRNVRCVYNLTDVDSYSDSVYSDNSELGFYIAYDNETICTGAANIDNSINGNLTATKTVLKRQAIQDYMVLLGITLVVFAVILTIILFLFIFRQEVRVWFHSKFGVRLFHNATDLDRDDKLFDAFISYSSKDEAWVAEVLAPALEPNYKLCLHYRDFPVGAFLADTIVQAVESSRRTIMILSENFIKSEWCRFEFKSAHHQVLRDRRRRLIVVLLGEVPQKDLDPDIRLYLKTNVYFQWGDKLFWEKLKFALPDVPNNHRRRGSSRGPHVHHHVHRHGGTPRGQPPNAGGGANSGGGSGGGGAGGTQRTVAIHI
ncbi:slit [Holotrichia oblita]|uniref:Slit n=2 Tax=Holotrichia oblita TaxID=644536 RepID=A0ACB9SWA9_HOLOL|nr:slit [Holotrichia oblita]KAI4458709.1 slit [Holotrichia oblita]